jgi:hypothetical protein
MEQSQNLPQRHVKEHPAAAQRTSHCTRQSLCCTKPLPQRPNIQSCHPLPPAYNLLFVQAHGGVEVQLHTLMSALGRGKCHLHAPRFFAPWETDLNTHWKRGQVCPKIMWAFWGREISATSTKNLKHCIMETQHTVQYVSVGHTVQYDSVTLYNMTQLVTLYHSIQYVRTIRLIRDSHFGTRTWKKFNNAKAKSLKRVTNPFPTTSNSPNRLNIILSLFLGLPSWRFPRWLQEMLYAFLSTLQDHHRPLPFTILTIQSKYFITICRLADCIITAHE